MPQRISAVMIMPVLKSEEMTSFRDTITHYLAAMGNGHSQAPMLAFSYVAVSTAAVIAISSIDSRCCIGDSGCLNAKPEGEGSHFTPARPLTTQDYRGPGVPCAEIGCYSTSQTTSAHLPSDICTALGAELLLGIPGSHITEVASELGGKVDQKMNSRCPSEEATVRLQLTSALD